MQNKVLIKDKVFQEDKLYNDKVILRYKIKYPYFISDNNQSFFDMLNNYYCMHAMDYIRNDIAQLYEAAIENYENNKADGYPFNPYEVLVEYTITYNKNCAISLYFDRYEYTGGAHGNTIRYSDTWDINAKRNIILSDLVSGIPNYREFIIESIIKTVQNQIKQGNNYFFENYSELIRSNFKESNYFLTDKGIVIYFQQYDIAPYSSGIQIFTIPFTTEGIVEPKCK